MSTSNPITVVLLAVRDVIVNADVGPVVSSEKHFLPEIDDRDIPKFSACVILIAPRGIESVAATRAADQDDVAIDVGLISKLTPKWTDADIDALFSQIHKLNKALRIKLATDPAASWIGRTCSPIYDRDRLKEHGIFYSVTTHTYRMIGA